MRSGRFEWLVFFVALTGCAALTGCGASLAHDGESPAAPAAIPEVEAEATPGERVRVEVADLVVLRAQPPALTVSVLRGAMQHLEGELGQCLLAAGASVSAVDLTLDLEPTGRAGRFSGRAEHDQDAVDGCLENLVAELRVPRPAARTSVQVQTTLHPVAAYVEGTGYLQIELMPRTTSASPEADLADATWRALHATTELGMCSVSIGGDLEVDVAFTIDAHGAVADPVASRRDPRVGSPEPLRCIEDLLRGARFDPGLTRDVTARIELRGNLRGWEEDLAEGQVALVPPKVVVRQSLSKADALDAAAQVGPALRACIDDPARTFRVEVAVAPPGFVKGVEITGDDGMPDAVRSCLVDAAMAIEPAPTEGHARLWFPFAPPESGAE